MQLPIPLLFYFQKGNEYSGAIKSMRYFLSPQKQPVLDEGGEAVLDKKGNPATTPVLDLHIWPDPWALNCTDPALRRTTRHPLTEAGRSDAIAQIIASYEAEFDRWQETPSILDSTPWYPAPTEESAE